eukprot:scaffold164947_cov38-Attheya_sp.AAC.1
MLSTTLAPASFPSEEEEENSATLLGLFRPFGSECVVVNNDTGTSKVLPYDRRSESCRLTGNVVNEAAAVVDVEETSVVSA